MLFESMGSCSFWTFDASPHEPVHVPSHGALGSAWDASAKTRSAKGMATNNALRAVVMESSSNVFTFLPLIFTPLPGDAQVFGSMGTNTLASFRRAIYQA
jgi:hypothetical protein